LNLPRLPSKLDGHPVNLAMSTTSKGPGRADLLLSKTDRSVLMGTTLSVGTVTETVAVEVPRSGKSYRFVRPLVLEEETRISFQYKS
jgi:hypothetical protein